MQLHLEETACRRLIKVNTLGTKGMEQFILLPSMCRHCAYTLEDSTRQTNFEMVVNWLGFTFSTAIY